VRVTFDPPKNAKNIVERGLPFERVVELAWGNRRFAGRSAERRRREPVRVLARLGDRLHVAVITMRGDAVHVISFRKANRQEVDWYEREVR
jgi:uncharacterized DUF497 family protein